jgi:hypothetical protein
MDGRAQLYCIFLTVGLGSTGVETVTYAVRLEYTPFCRMVVR